jgi:alpha-beta hydrolase superfamily lysophospholipase
MYQPTATGAPWDMAEDTTRISGRTWRRVCGLAAAGLVIAALASGGHGSSPRTSPGPSPVPTSVDVSGDSAQDPAAELERQRQAVQALNESSQLRYDAAQNTANSLTP